ncbi:MAG: GxxExxY protein [Thermoplasmata archaeon]|nr:GxxExxY protein [Thermoplasmata archaeon]
MENDDYPHRDLTEKIIGAAIEVQKILGSGFLESIYQKSLEKELTLQNIPFKSQSSIDVYYKNALVGTHVPDLIVDDNVVIELKAVKEINDVMRAQVMSYLYATGYQVGLIINFSKPVIDVKRVIKSK